MRRTALFVVIVVACATIHARAFAADPSPAPTPPSADQRARAQELFESALKDAERGDFVTACPKFRASQEADPKTSTLLNLGSCYEKNHQLASAWGAFKEASVRAGTAGRADFVKIADEHIAELEPKLARVTVLVPKESDVPGLVVTRDGMKVVTAERGVPIAADAGTHEFAASAEGKITWTTKLVVTDAQNANVTVPALADAPKPVTPPPPQLPITPLPPEAPPPAPYWTTYRIIGASAAGAGVVTITIGAVMAVVAKSQYSSALSLCENNNPLACPSGAVSDSKSAHGLADAGTGVFVAGAIVAAGGAALFFLSPKIETRAATFRIAPSIGGVNKGVNGVFLRGEL